MKISEMQLVTTLTGEESIEIVQNGASKRCTLEQIASAQPDSNGVYPDVPLNRVTLKRYSGQTSTTPVIVDNLGMIDALVATAYPVLIDRNSNIVAYLNGDDISKTVDGLPATLDDWTLQAMLRCGGFYKKYEYNAATNEKIFKFSSKKVRGYKYVRRRFLNLFGGTVETQDSKQVLLSNSGKWTSQNYNLTQYHQFAKNLGTNFREIATQDREVYRMYFWLVEKTFNSQSLYAGISTVSWDWWGKFTQAANGGQSSYGQFHKTGETLSISGHKGEKSINVTNSAASQVTVKPCKWLWRENMISGPYWIWEAGYLKKDGTWYRCKDLSKIAFTVTADYEAICTEPAVQSGYSDGGYVLEDFEDTLIPTLLGGSSTTGHCDRFWKQASPGAGTVYTPAGVGSADAGAELGVSVLSSSDVASFANAFFGGALASDDPTDTTPDGAVVA